ncbi:MAG: hypothetical protein QME61_04040 [Patescibacteria group bacterium]|nr:hypothetical protein [Patescibacteria group bacterium]
MTNLSVELIKKLYYKEKLGTWEIANKLNVSPWKVWKFMVKKNLPRRTPEEANEKRFDRQLGKFSLKQNLSKKEKELKTAGIMLYWTEGCKRNLRKRGQRVDFANSNPQMIKLFLKFLRKICGVKEKRLRVLLYYYANQSLEDLKRYWHKITRISLKQFTKPYVRKDFLPEKSGKMEHGLIHIRYSDTKLFHQIENWIKEYCEKNNV